LPFYFFCVMTHIAIAGAGPAGAATALLLARQGIRITLIDSEPDFSRAFRGEGLMPAGLAAIHQMGLQAVFESIPSRPLTSWDFYVGQQRRMRVMEPTEGLCTHIIDAGALVKAMVDKACELPNVKFYAGWQVNELQRDDTGRVTGLTATQREGEAAGNRSDRKTESRKPESRKTWNVDGVIACDGRYSRIRKLAGLALTQSPAQFDVLWFKLPAPDSLKSDLLKPDLQQSETPFMACLEPARQFALYPSWDGRLQIGWIVEKNTRQPSNLAALRHKNWIEEFIPALPLDLAEHFRTHASELEGPIYLDVQVGCCDQWSLPGLLLIGDAAHPMAPNRAQGMNMALRDAIVVANHLNSHLAERSRDRDSTSHKNETSQPIPTALWQAIQAERQPEIEAVQKMQLAEWRKVKFISQPGLPYWGFCTAATLFGRFPFVQHSWLHEQKGLRDGVALVQLRQ
jgi:2-polyprenyl-6-methoxyphenol hydroxylase-like FAD-dependent oxidoreductase